jgi:hypothetical protein
MKHQKKGVNDKSITPVFRLGIIKGYRVSWGFSPKKP